MNLKTVLAVVGYIAGITVSNLLIAEYGPAISVLNAFLFIGLDLALRDYLHEVFAKNRFPKLMGIIGTAAAISYALNPASGKIAAASVIAFLLATFADWAVYHALRKLPWHERANASNIVGAGVDSVVFPALAFGWPFLWLVMLGQFTAKVAGGLVWTLIIGYFRKEKYVEGPNAPLHYGGAIPVRPLGPDNMPIS